MSAHEQNSEAATRPYSFDLTLELERQLDNESSPNSPADAIWPHSLDPHVLASIITQLRASLTDVTRERDELLHTVTEQRAREAGAAVTMEDMVQKCSRMQEELDSARAKIQDDENTISILRTKVEESRFVFCLTLRSAPLTAPPDFLDVASCVCSLRGGRVMCRLPLTYLELTPLPRVARRLLSVPLLTLSLDLWLGVPMPTDVYPQSRTALI